MNPKARRSDLETQMVDGELVVYDLTNDHAHCLHPLAVQVWELCDGTRSAQEIAAALPAELEGAGDVDAVWEALDGLGAAGLLETPLAPPAAAGLTRRQLVRDLAAVGALGALTLGVRSIIAPTPVQAQSGTGVTQEQVDKEQQKCVEIVTKTGPTSPESEACGKLVGELQGKVIT